MISNSRVRTKTDRWTLGAVASLLMLAALDQTIVTTALPAIVSDLGRLDQLSWIVTAYLLTSTVSAPLYGKLGDMIGRKIMMQTAVLIFLLSSLAAAMANTMTWMLLARAVQGLGGGGLFVLAFTLVGDMVPMRDRGKIQGLFAAVFGFSSIVGPLAGGFFVDTLSWHWIFLINIPIGVSALIVLHKQLGVPQKKITMSNLKLDYCGLLSLSLFLASLIVFSTVGENSILDKYFSKTYLIIVCILSLILFVYIELKAINPIIPMSLFKINNFRIYSLIGLITGGVLFSLLTFLPFQLQIVRGMTPSESGIQLIPLTLGIIIGAALGGILLSKTGRYKYVPFFAGITLVFGLILLSFTDIGLSKLQITTCLIIIGLGLGPQLSVITTAVQNSAPPEHMGVATAALTTFRQIGSSVGVAALSSYLLKRTNNLVMENRIIHSTIENQTTIELKNFLLLSSQDISILQNALNGAMESVILVTALVAFLIIPLSLMAVEIPLKTSLEKT